LAAFENGNEEVMVVTECCRKHKMGWFICISGRTLQCYLLTRESKPLSDGNP